MRPFLFPDTAFETPTYFVLYCFSFLAALILGSNLARRRGMSPVQAIDLGIVSFVAGVIGARLFHILFESPDYYLLHPIRVFYFWQGGFVLYGGLICGILTGYFYLRSKRLPWRIWADLAAAPILMGIAVGRMGCLAAGCCYGKRTEGWWAIVFTDPRSAAPLHVLLHPTQLLESVGAFFLCLVTVSVYRRWYPAGRAAEAPPKRLFPGYLFFTSLMAYAVLRFFLEYLRGDQDRGVYLGGALSTSQIIAVVVFVGLSAGLYFLKKAHRIS